MVLPLADEPLLEAGIACLVEKPLAPDVAEARAIAERAYGRPVSEVFAEFEPPSSETLGLVFAIFILVLAFGSVMAMGLPVITTDWGGSTAFVDATVAYPLDIDGVVSTQQTLDSPYKNNKWAQPVGKAPAQAHAPRGRRPHGQRHGAGAPQHL